MSHPHIRDVILAAIDRADQPGQWPKGWQRIPDDKREQLVVEVVAGILATHPDGGPVAIDHDELRLVPMVCLSRLANEWTVWEPDDDEVPA